MKLHAAILNKNTNSGSSNYDDDDILQHHASLNTSRNSPCKYQLYISPEDGLQGPKYVVNGKK
jgi:hypothetical protein